MNEVIYVKEEYANTMDGKENQYQFKVEIVRNYYQTSPVFSNITINVYGRATRAIMGYDGYPCYALLFVNNGEVLRINARKINPSQSTTEYRLLGAWTTPNTPNSSWTGNISHNLDGTGSMSFSMRFYPNYSYVRYLPVQTTIEANVDLPRIPTNSILKGFSQEYYFDESETGLNLIIEKYDSGFYNSLNILYNGTVVAKRNGVDNNYNFILSQNELENLYNLSKNNGTVFLQFDLYTFTDSNMTTSVGNVSSNRILFLFKNATPFFENFDYLDINTTTVGLTNLPIIVIPNYSDVEIRIPVENKAIPQKGSTIVEYLFPDGKTEPYSDTEDVVHIISNYNYGEEIEVQAVDSRGLSQGAIVVIYKLVDYNQLPVISNLSIERENGVSTTSKLSCRIKLWNNDFADGRHNEVTKFEYRFKLPNEEWKDQAYYDATELFKTITKDQSIDNIVITKNDNFQVHLNGVSDGIPLISYDIQVKVSDGIETFVFNSDQENYTINSGQFLDTYYKSNTGYKYAVNGVVNTDLTDGLQVYGDLFINGYPHLISVSNLMMEAGDEIVDENIKNAKLMIISYGRGASTNSMVCQRMNAFVYASNMTFKNDTDDMIFAARVDWENGILEVFATTPSEFRLRGYILLF